MANILMLHASSEGQTDKITGFVSRLLVQSGHHVVVEPATSLPSFSAFDAVIIGASIHVGQYPKVVLDFITSHKGDLQRLPNAFFSVCLTTAQTDDTNRQVVQGYFQKLYEDTDWRPDDVASFAGALRFSAYGFFKRQLMKVITKRNGLSVDASRDHEYTDWSAIAAFAERFAQRLPRTIHAGGKLPEVATQCTRNIYPKKAGEHEHP